MKIFLIGTLTGIIISVCIGWMLRGHFVKTIPIEIEKVVTKTEWKDRLFRDEAVAAKTSTEARKEFTDSENFSRLLDCYISDLLFNYRLEGNTLSIIAYDACKEAKAEFKINTMIPKYGITGNYYLVYTEGFIKHCIGVDYNFRCNEKIDFAIGAIGGNNLFGIKAGISYYFH